MDNQLKNFTTLQIGGPAKKITIAHTREVLLSAIQESIAAAEEYLIIGSGSNLLVSDQGYNGHIIINKVDGIQKYDNRLTVQSGTLLQDLVDFANRHGLSGLESLAGIPGTVGGAIYGNAGAYGQTISDHLDSVSYFEKITEQIHSEPKDSCKFDYRSSIFKKYGDIPILEAVFSLQQADSANLAQQSQQIIKKREVKYPPGIKCPGSFFKNIIADSLPEQILHKIPSDKIVYGKIPAGALLELVGARGDSFGGIEIASYHANLFINKNNGTAKQFYELAKKYAHKVYSEFGIKLEPEVQLINLTPLSESY